MLRRCIIQLLKSYVETICHLVIFVCYLNWTLLFRQEEVRFLLFGEEIAILKLWSTIGHCGVCRQDCLPVDDIPDGRPACDAHKQGHNQADLTNSQRAPGIVLVTFVPLKAGLRKRHAHFSTTRPTRLAS